MDEMQLFLDDLDEFEDLQSPMNQVMVAIIGACIEVHHHLGPGFRSAVYKDALATELKLRGVGFSRQHAVAVKYKGGPAGEDCLDFLVEDMVVLKVKAAKSLRAIHTAAMKSQLKAAGKRVGLIVNFNVKGLMDGVMRVAMQ
jgi:GxxExxY protein